MSRYFEPVQCFGFATAGRSIVTGLLFLIAAAVGIAGQVTSLSFVRSTFDNGHFEEVVRLAPGAVSKALKTESHATASQAGTIQAHALMRLERYEEAAKALEVALMNAEKAKAPRSIAAVYLAKASLSRLLRDFPSAIKSSRAALTAAPSDTQTKLEYNLAIGRIMYSSGYDIAAIVWLERAEKLSAGLPISAARLDVLGHLSFAWASKFNYAKALEYGEKLVTSSAKTEFRYRHRLAFYEFSGLLNAVGQPRRAKQLREAGLNLALTAKDDYQSCLFLSTQMLDSLYSGDIEAAEKQLSMLDRIDRNRRFRFESILGRAVIAGLKGEVPLSDNHFKELMSLKAHSEFLVPHWKSILSERRKDWAASIEETELLRKLTEESNFRDGLPGVYLGLAKANWNLGKREAAIAYARRSATIVESDRPREDAPLSLSVLETYHSVYRLMAEMEEDANAALRLADYSKARVLRDRIENSALRRKNDLPTGVRERVSELSRKWIENADVQEELSKLERSATLSPPQQETEPIPVDKGTGEIKAPEGTAIVSYLFTIDGQLRAYVAEPDKPVCVVRLSMSEKEAETLAQKVRDKIRDKTFFKTDGKAIYDRLLAPLSLNSDHILIVPDKALWKIPFHALSPDGESYLIQQRTVSYAPSVSVLVNELKRPVPLRKSIQVFANDSFRDRYLAYVNREAANVARVFSSRPLVKATRKHFLDLAGGADIVHLSMHAQADPEEPLRSFLAF